MEKIKVLLFVFIIFGLTFPKRIFALCPIFSSENLLGQCECYPGYLNIDGSCVYGTSYCQSKYGYNSWFEDSLTTQGCRCSPGYVFNERGTKCISRDDSCEEKYGVNAHYFAGQCECENGYTLSNGYCINGDVYCSSKYGIHSEFDKYSINSCKCDFNYIWNFNKTKCISEDEKCKEEFGIGSVEDLGSCKCDQGYVWNLTRTKCITAEVYCDNQLGDNSEYDDLSEECICVEGYVLTDDEDECISEEDFCIEILGENSEYIGDSQCGCIDGYVQSDNEDECISEEDFCTGTLGENSEYIGDNECECIEGYEDRGDGCIEMSFVRKVVSTNEFGLGSVLKIVGLILFFGFLTSIFKKKLKLIRKKNKKNEKN